ncbi:MAG: DUF4982 domain-containing protein [Clostridiales bacterium]|nr:DUF4982 domain-containing protein [Clostridiales bacterium]
MNRASLLNDEWSFWLDEQCRTELPAQQVEWQPVTLPHDWQIWHVSNLYQDGTGWYRRTLIYSPREGQRVALYFEGVYMDTTVFVNGAVAGEWKNGYTSFHLDVTELLRPGENELLVRCLLRHPNSRWYSGAGIYRDVWLWEMPTEHLLPHSLYVAPKEQPDGAWTVSVQVELGCSDGQGEYDGAEVLFLLRDPSGAELDRHVLPAGRGTPISAEDAADYAQGERNILAVWDTFRLERPTPWDVDAPCCYRMEAALVRRGEMTDHLESVFGCRTVELDSKRGLLLNHRPLTLHGVCLHHDLGCLGSAFSQAAAERQLRIMKEMGANALRTAHNPPAEGVMELADRYGMLVVSEAFDAWNIPKNPYDYARFFPAWEARDVASWVRRDRNHPSLLLWSIGNEIYDTHAGPEGLETMRRLMAQVQAQDPWGNGTVTLGSNYMAWENTQRCGSELPAVGYNYGESLYAAHHAAHPDWVIYGSETGSLVQSRGIYHFPLRQSVLVDDDQQCSSLGNSRTSWGADGVEACLRADLEHPYTLGQFLWSGFDYIGEPTPYHTKNAYFGQVDTAGFPKDSYYHYQAGWNDYHTKPVLHLLPYWDWNEGQCIDLCVYSNAPTVELWVNGVSQGRRTPGQGCAATWQATYHPGVVEAAAYDEAGREIARTEEHSFADSAALRVEADRTTLTGDGKTLAFLTVTATDREGYPVRNARDRVTVTVRGAAQLVGLDNGDSTDWDEYKTDNRRLFSGKLLAVVAGLPTGGQAVVTAEGEGLRPASVTLTIQPAQSAVYRWTPCPVGAQGGAKPRKYPLRVENRSPIARKLELRADSTTLDREHPTAEVEVRFRPARAAQPVEWRCTDEKGIATNLVSLTPQNEAGTRVRVTALGDGAVQVRCLCRNGRPIPQLISLLDMTVEGMGSRYPDPFVFRSAGLYSRSSGEVGNGNERGIATGRKGMTWVAYEELDFGRAGGDTVTVSVFELEGKPTPIRFWRGIPYAQGSRMIGQRLYHKPKQWNVYQEETFRLDEPLTGVQTFGIELHTKVHIKGFQFQRRSRAWDVILATRHDLLYGDSYRETEEGVLDIGNNVSLVFRELDFGEKGSDTLSIRGRTELENNTIHILFHRDGVEERRTVEFARQPAWGTQTFRFAPVYGMQEITFLFLPGSRFDFQSFQFSEGRGAEP